MTQVYHPPHFDPSSSTVETCDDSACDIDVDFGGMGSIFAHFLEIMGWSVAIIDRQGKVLASSKWHGLCMASLAPLTLCDQLNNDVAIAQAIHQGKVHIAYRSYYGLDQCSVPIIVHAKPVATLFIGQFLVSEQDWQQLTQLSTSERHDFLHNVACVPALDADNLPKIRQLMLDLAQYTLLCAAQLHRVIDAQAVVKQQVIAHTQEVERHKAESVLKRYKMIIDHTIEGFWLVDAQGYLQEVNPAYAAMLGYSTTELQQMHIRQLDANEKNTEEIKAHIAKIVAQGSDRFETSHRHKLGHSIDVEVSASFLAEVQQFFVFIRDITKRKQAERALAESELKNRSNSERLALAAKIAAFGVWDWDINENIILWNDSMFDIYGIEKSDTISYELWMGTVLAEDHAKLARSVQKVISEECRDEIEFRIARPNGEVRHLFSAKGVVKNEFNQISRIVGVNVDITERNKAQQTIRQLAFYDEVTRLPNRRLLLERLQQSLRAKQHSSKPLALLLLDLDRFKAVNDNFGHASGDELLQQVALRLQTHSRPIDTVARLGGDEFVLLLEHDADESNEHALVAAHTAQAIVADLSRPFALSFSHEVRIGVSIGISLYPQHGTTADSLINNADLALYQAKQAGRGCFSYFSKHLATIMRDRASLEARLHKAIERQQLRLLYQAQVDISSGNIIGAEALLRWQSPDGLISPTRFISIAEESNLIVSLGAWALRELCQQGQRWLVNGLPPLVLSINVSPYQFRRSDMSVTVAQVLAETGFPANYLSMEITESGLMEHRHDIIEKFLVLRALGVRFAIDDFGTGYSSLAYLKRLPVDTLKIDKSFIDDIPQLADDMTITATIIAMGHTLGLKVLAEGVETAEQLTFLQEKGCDEYQGYYKSNPLPAEAFAELLRQEQNKLSYAKNNR